MTGQTIGHYQILEEIGQGGMGQVWKAFDTHLNRLVAIKVLSPHRAAGPDSRRRFVHEAQAASGLNHPNIVTVHDIGNADDGSDYIVMEFVAGRTLDKLISSGQLGEAETLRYGVQMADALSRAHAIGLIHRDLKPSNIIVTDEGSVKLLDFGLAKLSTAEENERTETQSLPLTAEGTIVGTVAYMSPEQAEGKPLDVRSDVFSFGAVLYEMLSGEKPFHGESQVGTLLAIVKERPRPLEERKPGLDPRLVRIVSKCLEKDREARYASGAELHRELELLHRETTSGTVPLTLQLRRAARSPRFFAPALALLVVLAVLTGWWWNRRARINRARDVSIPQIAALLKEGRFVNAFDLAKEAESLVPDDARLKSLWPDIAHTVTVQTEPPGADVSFKEINEPDSAWRPAGQSPAHLMVPRGYFRWKLVKEGFLPSLEFKQGDREQQLFRLTPAAEVPAGMVLVPTAPSYGVPISPLGTLQFDGLPAFWIDRTEVTNSAFKRFVDAGGYGKREYWKHPFERGGKTLSWEEAVREFRDSTGRPGPATWEAGGFKAGEDEYPVRGVSWYEAAAYAEFAGKQLPTIFHFYRASDPRTAPYVASLYNFKGAGPAPVGQFRGLSPVDAADLGGNVKEWCLNESEPGLRFIMGGAWYEPMYMFYQPDARSPWDRSGADGFRCVRSTEAVASTWLRSVPRGKWGRKPPVSDEDFKSYLRLFAHEPVELQPMVVKVDDSHPDWIRETVSFRAAYGKERVIGYLLKPKGGKPPFQTIVYHPGAGVRQLANSQSLDGVSRWDFLIRTGRAVFHPVFAGAYERRAQPQPGGLAYLNEMVARVQDFQRSVDYLLTRADVDHGRLAYLGASWGAASGAWILPLENRFRAAVLMDGGLFTVPGLAELDQANYAPRVRTPVLMLNGRSDYFFPLENSQKPMFELLGTPRADKRHVLFDTAHDVGLFRQEVIRETLDWLDKYLGPVGQ